MVTRRSFATPAATSLVGAFVLAGHTGVSLFFVLSGFLLARPFLVEAAGGPHVSRRAYGTRRALRILPAYALAVVVASVDCATRPVELLRGVPYLLFLDAVPGLTTPLTPYSEVWWTLATEVQFYLALPVLAWIGRRGGWRVATVLAIAYVAAYVGAVAGAIRVGSLTDMVALFGSLFGRGPLFALGAAAAWVLPRLETRQWRRAWLSDVVLIAVVVALGLLLQ